MKVLFGPFRGARVAMNPRTSLRKIFGLYEHELNHWIAEALPRVRRVLDVGANDGYFTFGCAAAMRRMNLSAEILAFEPQEMHVAELLHGISLQPSERIAIRIVQSMVGDRTADGMTTLDALETGDRENTLIKLDIEGAEESALLHGQSWMNSRNLFLIEVHQPEYLVSIPALFAKHGIRLNRVSQQPHWLFGRECREADNAWLVSELQQ